MFVREYGAREAPGPVLWLHGLGESGLCFERAVTRPELSGWRHLVPDLPGYGRSAWPRLPSPLADLAGLLAEWLQGRGERPAVLVGHSMGGVLGQLLAELFPRLARGFVNVEGNVSMGDCTASAQAAAYPLDGFLSVGFGTMQEAVYHLGEDDRAFRGAYVSMRLCDPRSFHLHAHALVEVSRREEMARRMAALPLPRLFVAGVPGGAAPRSLELLAEASVEVSRIEPSGHWPFIDRPEEFAKALQAFLRPVTESALA
jgi:pimeloyl-ACP methyl ester carboxylesterase